MQTFLPYRDFARTAKVLDTRRLGKQRVEVLQILRALTREKYGWQNHPAVRMWRGHEEALVAYGVAICEEWRRRGYNDTCEMKILEDAGVDRARLRTQRELLQADELPPWLGNRRVHRSHQAALKRKDPGHYGPHFPNVDPDDVADYVWPVSA